MTLYSLKVRFNQVPSGATKRSQNLFFRFIQWTWSKQRIIGDSSMLHVSMQIFLYHSGLESQYSVFHAKPAFSYWKFSAPGPLLSKFSIPLESTWAAIHVAKAFSSFHCGCWLQMMHVLWIKKWMWENISDFCDSAIFSRENATLHRL